MTSHVAARPTDTHYHSRRDGAREIDPRVQVPGYWRLPYRLMPHVTATAAAEPITPASNPSTLLDHRDADQDARFAPSVLSTAAS